MGMGRHGGTQPGMWVATSELPRSPGHTFYDKLNRLLAEADCDRRCEELCEPYYADDVGRPGIPPGVYFRMLFVGYFEGLNAQRARIEEIFAQDGGAAAQAAASGPGDRGVDLHLRGGGVQPRPHPQSHGGGDVRWKAEPGRDDANDLST